MTEEKKWEYEWTLWIDGANKFSLPKLPDPVLETIRAGFRIRHVEMLTESEFYEWKNLLWSAGFAMHEVSRREVGPTETVFVV